MSLAADWGCNKMAYTATVTKQSVAKVNDKIYRVTIDVTVNDGAEDVFQAIVSEQYNNNTVNLDEVKSRLLAQLQQKWDKYVDEQTIFSAATFDTIVEEIETFANSYINS
jgi:hypothetical protein